jgi:hypothetical protein
VKAIPGLLMVRIPLRENWKGPHLQILFRRKFMANNLPCEDRKSACLVFSVDILSEKVVYIFPYW